MGEITDMILDGRLCQLCGGLVNDDKIPCGYPMFCPDCLEDNSTGDNDEIIKKINT